MPLRVGAGRGGPPELRRWQLLDGGGLGNTIEFDPALAEAVVEIEACHFCRIEVFASSAFSLLVHFCRNSERIINSRVKCTVAMHSFRSGLKNEIFYDEEKK